MLTFVVGWVLVMSLGVCIGYFAMQRAPIGYEDKAGFYYGPEQVVQVETASLAAVSPAHA